MLSDTFWTRFFYQSDFTFASQQRHRTITTVLVGLQRTKLKDQLGALKGERKMVERNWYVDGDAGRIGHRA
jgi:hypothetical protein